MSAGCGSCRAKDRAIYDLQQMVGSLSAAVRATAAQAESEADHPTRAPRTMLHIIASRLIEAIETVGVRR